MGHALEAAVGEGSPWHLGVPEGPRVPWSLSLVTWSFWAAFDDLALKDALVQLHGGLGRAVGGKRHVGIALEGVQRTCSPGWGPGGSHNSG